MLKLETDSINIFLDSVCNELRYSQIKKNIRQELYEHIIEEKNNNIENGINDKEAELIAIKKMGNPDEISKEFNKIYKRKFDWKLLILLLTLMLTNCLLIITVANHIDNKTQYIVMNITYSAVGIIMAIIFYFIDYRKFQKFSLRYSNLWNYMYNDRYNFI